MSNALVRAVSAIVVVALAGAPAMTLADGKRDLEDGIAFYENLDTDRAVERLRAASKAQDLGGGDRARAFMYLGIVLFETGKESDAESQWQSAFALQPKVAVPSGTSPKIVQAIEKARAKGAPKATPDGPRLDGGGTPVRSPSPTPSPKPSPSPSPTLSPAPYVDPTPEIDAAPAVVETSPPPPEDDEGGGVPGWLIWTAIGAAVAGGTVAAILIATSGPTCERGACLLVELR